MSIAEQLTTIAENEPKVYNAGYNQGVYDSGYNAHEKDFWDSYQNYGNRTKYEYAFYGEGWNDVTLVPRYSMKPTDASRMFAYSQLNCDLPSYLTELGITLDFSKAAATDRCFAYAYFTHIGEVNTTSAHNLRYMFYRCEQLETIDKLILKSDGTQNLGYAFNHCPNLKNITVEGAIGGTTNFDIAQSTMLTKESITSIINAVSTTQTVKITLSRQAVISAFGSVTNTEWLTLKNTRPKCTVALA